MRILMLSPTFPFPLNMGSKIRIYNILKELSRSHEVTLVSLVHGNVEKNDIEKIKSISSELYIYSIPQQRRWISALKSLFSLNSYRVVRCWSPQLKNSIHDVISKEFDIIWVHFLNMFFFLPHDFSNEPLVVLDQHNADELMWKRFLNKGPWFQRLFAIQNIWKVRLFQKKIFKNVDVILSVSEKEAEFMLKRANKLLNVFTTPNGVDIEYFRPLLKKNKKIDMIVFCGSMDVLMNIDAVNRFVFDIFPIVKRSVPNAKFYIIGRNPVPQVRKLSKIEGIHVTGTVDDIRPFFEKAKVAVAPFRYGAGTKFKILEAMAMGMPIVSTSIGCQGIEVVHRTHLFIEDDKQMFAKRIIELMKNEDLCRIIGLAGRKLVEQKYSWRSIVRNTASKLEELLKEKRTIKQKEE